jgi:hypothetical protein
MDDLQLYDGTLPDTWQPVGPAYKVGGGGGWGFFLGGLVRARR